MDASTLPLSTLINHLCYSSHETHHFPSKSSSPNFTTFTRKTSKSSDSSLSTVAHATMSSDSFVAPKPLSLYDILRVKKNASMMDIKKAYRHLAKLYHPDSSSDQADSREFMAIRDAYATLSDPTARALYDLSIGVGQRRGYQRIGNFAGSGYGHGWRWETDQCW